MRHPRHSCNQKRILLTFFYIFTLSVISPFSLAADVADSQESHPGISRESKYAEAVIAYNKRKTDETVKILDELLKDSPTNIEYLELKALALKGKGDDKSSLDLYLKLYQAKPEKERGPYAFEIASILEKQKKTSEAKPYFEKSAELEFNAAASNLYIGMGAFNATRYAEAEAYFGKANGSGIAEIDLIAQYYQSICFFKLNFSSRGVQELIDSRDLAQSALKKDEKNANAKNILDASTKMLSPFNFGQWFGNASLMTQYDSNIQQLPSGSANTTATANSPSTLKENIMVGMGYMSAPLNTFQLITGYRASYNKNFNSDTKAYEYFTNNVSVNLNYRALAKTTYGIKVDSNLVFQNSLTDPTNSNSGYEYQKFNVTLGGGFAIRHQIDGYWRAEGEFNLRNQHYFADSSQKGVNSSFSLSARRTGGDNYFNPGVTILQESNNAQGSLSYYRAYGMGFSNTMNLPNMLILNQSLDFLFTHYSRISPLRTDANYSLKLGALKFMTPKFTLMADFTYITNYSSIESSYTYNRFTTSAGVGFML